ncbi:MAG: conjugative transposon protein TraM, partial [Odoribacter sp.]|nr:conjugative transposon protein TraM [Odoribacter sp.]
VPVELTAYDTDGQPGINVPGSAEINALKEAAANAGGSLGTSVSFTQNAGQQVAMDLTKGIMQSGSQYLSKKIRTVKIHLKAGYRLFLLTKEK